MSGSALWAVQDAVYDVLSADATLETLLGGTPSAPKVYDEVPGNTTFPYVVMGDATETREDTIGKWRKSVTLGIEAWSRYEGWKNLEQIVDRIAILLDGVALTITGYTHVRTIHDKTVVGRDADGVTRRALIFLRVLVTQS